MISLRDCPSITFELLSKTFCLKSYLEDELSSSRFDDFFELSSFLLLECLDEDDGLEGGGDGAGSISGDKTGGSSSTSSSEASLSDS